MQGQVPFSQSWGTQGMHTLGSPKEMLFHPFGMRSFSLGVLLGVGASHEGHPHFTSATHRLFSLRDTQSYRATQSSKQESDCRALHPILKGPLALSLPSAERRLKGSEESPAGGREALCLSSTNRGTQCGAGGLQPQEMRSCSRRTGQGAQWSCCPPSAGLFFSSAQ